MTERYFLPDELAPTEAFSVTFGRHFNLCRHAGYLYAKYRRTEAATIPMDAGAAGHRVLELATRTAVENGEIEIPADVVRAICAEVYADPAYAPPVDRHDYLREAAVRWASEETIDPGAVVALETLFELDVDGMRVRAKIDRADIIEGGAAVRIRDYKFARALPSYEDIGRKVDGGRIAAKQYQLVVYALAVAYGVPVRVSPCPACSGLGGGCGSCNDRLVVEQREPFGVAEGAQRFDLSYVFPGVETREGLMATRDVSLTRTELASYMDSLRAQVALVRHSVASGEWPARYSEEACGQCPSPMECPIPVQLRSYAGTINTEAEAAEAMERLAAEKQIHAARWDEVKRFVKRRGIRLFYGRDRVVETGFVEKVTITDRDAMFDAVDAAVEYGAPFNRALWVKRSSSSPIVDRKLSEAELEEREQDG